jgi:hypothetical protein
LGGCGELFGEQEVQGIDAYRWLSRRRSSAVSKPPISKAIFVIRVFWLVVVSIRSQLSPRPTQSPVSICNSIHSPAYSFLEII